MTRLTVLIVQHGEKEREPGDPGLTQYGLGQVVTTAEYLAGSNLAIGAAYASPMRRAQETGRAIASALGLPIRTDNRLRERMNWSGPQVQSLEEFLSDWELASRDRDFVPSSGDSSRQAGERFRQFLEELPDGQTVAVVTHGGVTTDLLRDLIGDDNLARRSPFLVANGVPCCGLTTLYRSDMGWSVQAMADTSHLDEPLAHRPG